MVSRVNIFRWNYLINLWGLFPKSIIRSKVYPYSQESERYVKNGFPEIKRWKQKIKYSLSVLYELIEVQEYINAICSRT